MEDYISISKKKGKSWKMQRGSYIFHGSYRVVLLTAAP